MHPKHREVIMTFLTTVNKPVKLTTLAGIARCSYSTMRLDLLELIKEGVLERGKVRGKYVYWLKKQ